MCTMAGKQSVFSCKYCDLQALMVAVAQAAPAYSQTVPFLAVVKASPTQVTQRWEFTQIKNPGRDDCHCYEFYRALYFWTQQEFGGILRGNVEADRD